MSMKNITNEKSFKEGKPGHILIVDDDPVFRKLLAQRARQRNFIVTTCASLKELGPVSTTQRFDLAVVDYFLTDMGAGLTGTEVAQALEGLPIILISATNAILDFSEPWATSIRRYVCKQKGIDTILDAAESQLKKKDPNNQRGGSYDDQLSIP